MFDVVARLLSRIVAFWTALRNLVAALKGGSADEPVNDSADPAAGGGIALEDKPTGGRITDDDFDL